MFIKCYKIIKKSLSLIESFRFFIKRFKIRINFRGINVKTEIIANNIAIPVNTPK